MRRLVLRLVSAAAVLLTLAACADSPTSPDREQAPEGASRTTAVADTGDHQAPSCCETVIVIVPGPDDPPECDPWTSLTWCTSGGDCMTSTPSASTDDDATKAGSTGCPGGGGTPIGGSPVPPPPPPPPPGDGDGTTCDPQLDPNCYKPLTKLDSMTIATALAQYLRAPASIPDATARQQCENMRNAFNNVYAMGRVYRGATTTMPGDPGIVPHTGAWDPNTQKMHVDPKYLDRAATGNAAAMRELLDTLLHEGAHVLMMQHPNGYTSTPWGPVFSDPYFNLLSPGTNSCIAW